MACMSAVGEETNKPETENSISNSSSAHEAVALIYRLSKKTLRNQDTCRN